MSFRSRRYVALDLETTGIFKHKDRIVELSLVELDLESGDIVDTYTTLVNPGRPLTNVSHSGLNDELISQAPPFSHLAAEILRRLRGRTLVAHNAALELGFIEEEFKRLELDISPLNGVCTLRLAYLFGPSDRRLSFCCRHFGFPFQDGAGSLEDAICCARLFRHYIKMAEDEGYKDFDELGINLTAPANWPELPAVPANRGYGLSFSRERASKFSQQEKSYLANLVQKLPPASRSSTAFYYQKLDQALADGVVSLEEAEALCDLAATCGLSRVQIEAINQKYLRDLARLAYQDSDLDGEKMAHINSVGKGLGLAQREIEQILLQAQSVPQSAWSIYEKEQDKLKGKKVCFLGSSEFREEAFAGAQELGLIPVEEVVKGLDYLVCAEDEFQSSQADEARNRGVQVIAEPIFWRMLGVSQKT